MKMVNDIQRKWHKRVPSKPNAFDTQQSDHVAHDWF